MHIKLWKIHKKSRLLKAIHFLRIIKGLISGLEKEEKKREGVLISELKGQGVFLV